MIEIRVRSLVWFLTGFVLCLVLTLLVTQAWRVDAAPGDEDSTFVPITPCRLMDTRPGNDRVGPNASFGVDDTKTIAATGSNGKCVGIPADAVGLSLNMTAVGATEQTFLTVWSGGARPVASSLNPAPGQPPVPNAVNTPLSAGSFNVYNRAGTVNVLIDVNGYYTKSSLVQIEARLNAVEASQAALELAAPFAVFASGEQNQTLELANEVVVRSVTVTAPVTGTVTVVSSLFADEESTDSTLCSITTGNTLDETHLQGATTADIGMGMRANQLAGTRGFSIAAGATVEYRLVCRDGDGDGISEVHDSSLTAVFTPAP